eukprot:scaffold28.g7558.t1
MLARSFRSSTRGLHRCGRPAQLLTVAAAAPSPPAASGGSPPIIVGPMPSPPSTRAARHLPSAAAGAAARAAAATASADAGAGAGAGLAVGSLAGLAAPPAAFPPPPPAADSELPLWMQGVWATPLDLPRRVFCNRSLNLRSIQAVGFDMDYTLAQYLPETFEALAHEQTVDKLVSCFGYPRKLYDLTFDYRYMARGGWGVRGWAGGRAGLIIDKRRGNIVKADRHKRAPLPPARG